MSTQQRNAVLGRPVIFGEVLFDHFPGGQDVLGGAPFNVAWHLQGFGLAPLFIGRVGADSRGNTVAATMEKWGMDGAGLQRDNEHPTGQVKVELQDGQPRFEILPRQAYDFIEATPVLPLLKGQRVSLWYHGTLATRHAVSSASLQQLIVSAGAPVFVDVNLRAPWWNKAAVLQIVETARWAKLNHEELELLADGSPAQSLEERARSMYKAWGLELLIITQGESGALFIAEDTILRGVPPAVTGFVDSVGAGDAFSAVTIMGMLQGWDRAVTLDRALEFAARICTQRGATAVDADLYEDMTARWQS